MSLNKSWAFRADWTSELWWGTGCILLALAPLTQGALSPKGLPGARLGVPRRDTVFRSSLEEASQVAGVETSLLLCPTWAVWMIGPRHSCGTLHTVVYSLQPQRRHLCEAHPAWGSLQEQVLVVGFRTQPGNTISFQRRWAERWAATHCQQISQQHSLVVSLGFSAKVIKPTGHTPASKLKAGFSGPG